MPPFHKPPHFMIDKFATSFLWNETQILFPLEIPVIGKLEKGLSVFLFFYLEIDSLIFMLINGVLLFSHKMNLRVWIRSRYF